MAGKPKDNRRFVSYLRVSTARQGANGLGVEAQRRAVADHVSAHGGKLVAEYAETESGARNDRPALAEALAACRADNAVLLVARLDRLGRNVAFLAALMDSGVEFTACDMPEANRLTLHVMAAVAEAERQAISERTRAALAAAKARGTRLGNPGNMGAADMERGRALGREARTRAALAWARDVLPAVEAARARGAGSLREVAAYLNERGTPARRGGRWSAAQVSRVLALAGEA